MHSLIAYLHLRPVFGFMLDAEIKGSWIIQLSLVFTTLRYEYFDPHTGAEEYDDLTIQEFS